ncbi:MAG: rhomboid family intramembrane serine protease [Sandaracinaceae bacterium]|nr:rhomboid family intramembrane serine protease [Sandaracinaceae bacterium]
MFGLPRLTLGIIAICSLLHVVAWGFEHRAVAGADAAQEQMMRVLTQHPEACVDFAISGIQEELLDAIQPPQCDATHVLTEADHELVAASRELLANLNRIPILRLGYRPGRPTLGTLFASMWMHGDFFHLLGNMVFLLLAGSVIESFWGPARFAALYLAAGLAGTLAHHAMNVGDLAPMVGASGAISGLLGAFVVSYPRTRIKMGYLVWLLVFFRRGTFMMPAWAAIPLWGAQQLFGALYDPEGGVAYGAHIGGLGIGLLAGVLAFVMGMDSVPEREPQVAEPPPPAAPRPSVPRAPSVVAPIELEPIDLGPLQPAGDPLVAPDLLAPDDLQPPAALESPFVPPAMVGPLPSSRPPPAARRVSAYPDGIPLDFDLPAFEPQDPPVTD